MPEASFNNLQTQSAVQMDAGYLGSTSDVSETAKGQFGAQTVTTSSEVDPSTKDDECASTFQAEKNTKKYQKDKDKDAKNRLNALQKIKDPQKSQEQDQRSRRISKNTQLRLASIAQTTSSNLSGTIQERSQKLFDGSEKAYQDFFDELDTSALQKNCTQDSIAKSVKKFGDIAEQHNALQIVADVWERKLTNLKTLSRDLSRERETSAQAETQQETQQDYEAIQNQIKELEHNLEEVKNFQTGLMAQHGARIEDSYTLAPLLRETTAHYTHDITLPPKSFNALILDEVLPLKGEPYATFDCLTRGLIENMNPSSGSPIDHFKHNLEIVETCLTQELQSCPDQNISAGILNTIRTVEKLETVQKLNVQLITRLSDMVSYETPNTLKTN